MEAREAAVLMLKWATRQENLPVQMKFLQQLQEMFKNCLKFLNPASINRIKLWQSFFLLCSSDNIKEMWKDFLSTVKVKPTHTLYQHLTAIMFHEEIIKKVKNESSASAAFQPLTEDEGNALQYTAGYICRHLRKQLERGNHAMKEELVVCLMELTKDRDSDKCDFDEEWTVRVDRGGGLWYVCEEHNVLVK